MEEKPRRVALCACGGRPIRHYSPGQWFLMCRQPGCTAMVIATSSEKVIESWNALVRIQKGEPITDTPVEEPRRLALCACGGKPIGHRSPGEWILMCRQPGCTAMVIASSRAEVIESWNKLVTEQQKTLS